MLQPSVQTAIQSDMQTGHSNDEVELEKTDQNSSLLDLASISVELLKYVDQKNVSSSAYDISLEEHIPNVDLDPPSREVISP